MCLVLVIWARAIRPGVEILKVDAMPLPKRVRVGGVIVRVSRVMVIPQGGNDVVALQGCVRQERGII